MRKSVVSFAALAAFGVLVSATAAKAALITYIFTGVGTGFLDSVGFAGDFTVKMVSDTSTVTSGGGELRNTGTTTVAVGATIDTILSPVLIENTAAPGFMGFGQTLAPFPDESLTAPVFETYNLTHALGLTSGGLSVAPATYQTAGGTLDFTSISALSFQATGGVPEPSTWAMMLVGFAGLGYAGYRASRRAAAATA
jgi:PEP-CTERM motif